MNTSTMIGFEEPPSFSAPLQAELLDRVEEAATELLSRHDQAEKVASLLAGMALCPAGEPFTAKEVARRTPNDRRSSYRQIGQFLDGGGWKVDSMRRWLVICGAEAQIEAIVVETFEMLRPAGVTDIVSIHLMGKGYSIPVGWKRIDIPFSGGDHPVDFDYLESNGLAVLLQQLREDCDAGGVSLAGLPIVVRDALRGENQRLRDEVDAFGCEQFVEVSPFFKPPFASEHSYTDQARGASLVESMPLGNTDIFPEPRPIGPAGAPNSELVVPYVRSGRPGYGIARPRPRHPARLGGYRNRARALELAEIASRVSLPDAARRLRLHQFRHQRDAGWVAVATLVSFWQAHSIGPPPLPSA
jgi:hypothetical protein